MSFANNDNCAPQTQVIVVAKNIQGLSELNERNDKIVKYRGLLFEIWNEIAKYNNYS
jgi:hypothetical protein